MNLKNPNHPVLGSATKVEPIRSKTAIDNIKKILATHPRDLCLFTFGINTAFRANELLSIRLGQVKNLSAGDSLELKESKTQKHRRVTINKTAAAALMTFLSQDGFLRHRPEDDAPIFHSHKSKGVALIVPSVTRLVKGWCAAVGLKGNYGSHTLRKTWGYWQYKRGTPVPLLMAAFGHASQQQTLAYLGIQEKDVKQIYDMEL